MGNMEKIDPVWYLRSMAQAMPTDKFAFPQGGKISTIHFLSGSTLVRHEDFQIMSRTGLQKKIWMMLGKGTTWTEICQFLAKVERGTVEFIAVWNDETLSGYALEDGRIYERRITLGDDPV